MLKRLFRLVDYINFSLFVRLFKKRTLCQPAFIYLMVSIFSIFFIAIQNLNDCSRYHVGSFSCQVTSVIPVFIVKFVYVIFWTYILNLICNDHNKALAWLLVLVPYILSFVLIGFFMLT